MVYGNFEYKILEDGTVGLVGYRWTDLEEELRIKDIVIPKEIEGKKVSTICKDCFQSQHKIRSIVIPEGIQTIETNAFNGHWYGGYNGLSLLKEIHIPASVVRIRPGAFNGCNALERIVVHPDNPVYDSRDNCNAIINTKNNKLVAGCVNTIIPNGIKMIGMYAFAICEGLEEIVIPDSVENISDRAFWLCESLKEIDLPKSTKLLGNGVFANCTELKHIELPNGIEKIGKDMFRYCSKLESIYIPNTVVEIGEDAFKFSGLKEINIPSSVKILGERAFIGCAKLENVSMSDKIKKIGKKTFSDCKELKNVELPLLLEEIEEEAFANCCKLEEINIPNRVTKIGKCAFFCCDNLKEVTLGDNVEIIDSQAFVVCGMKYFKFPKNLKKIASNVLFRCPNLEVVEFENTSRIESFYRNNLEFLPKLQKVITGDNVSRKVAMAIVEVAFITKNILLLDDKVLDVLTKGQLKKYEERSRAKEQTNMCSRFITAYNKKYGDNQVVKQI